MEIAMIILKSFNPLYRLMYTWLFTSRIYVGLSDNENPDFRVEWIFDIRIYKLELVMNNVIEHCFSHVQYTCIEWCVYLIENSLGRSIANKLLAVFQISCLEVKSSITNQARVARFWDQIKSLSVIHDNLYTICHPYM